MMLSKNRNRVKADKSDRVFDAVHKILMFLAFVIVAYPIWYIIIASFSSATQVQAGKVVFLPKDFTLIGYKHVIEERDIWIGFRNSIFYTVTGVCMSLFCSVCAAYPMSRKDFAASKILTIVYTITMFFNGGIIPLFLVIKNLHMYNTIWAILFPTTLSVYNIFVMKSTFISSIPNELLEAARIDGCSNTRFIVKIVVPISKPILAVMALFYASARWNEYMNCLMFLTDRNKFSLQVFLREILVQTEYAAGMMTGSDLKAVEEAQLLRETLKYSLIIIASIPMILIYPFVQKYFVKGIMLGAVKG